MYIVNQFTAGGSRDVWVVVTMTDGMIFEGRIVEEASHGVYLSIGGQPDRLSLFPWHQVTRIVYKAI